MKQLKKTGILISSLLLIGSISNFPMFADAADSSSDFQTFSVEKQEEALRKFLLETSNEEKNKKLSDSKDEVVIFGDDESNDVLEAEIVEDSEDVLNIENLVSDSNDELVDAELDIEYYDSELTESEEIVSEDQDANLSDAEKELIETIYEDEFTSEFEDIHNTAVDQNLFEDETSESEGTDDFIGEIEDILNEVVGGEEVVEDLDDENFDENPINSEIADDVADKNTESTENSVTNTIEESDSNKSSNYVIANYDLVGLGVEGIEILLILIVMGMFISMKGKVQNLEKFTMSQSAVRTSNQVVMSQVPSSQQVSSVQSFQSGQELQANQMEQPVQMTETNVTQNSNQMQ